MPCANRVRRGDIDLDGLRRGMMPGAIHLSMARFSTAAARYWRERMSGCMAGRSSATVFGNPDATGEPLFIVADGVRPMWSADPPIRPCRTKAL